MLAIAFAAASACGAVLRVAADRVLRHHARGGFPLGILAVNVTGSLALGVVAGAVRSRGLDADVATVLGTGFCGAYTTFSTFAVDTVGLAARGHTLAAATNVAASVLCLSAAAIGLALIL